jgi:LysM repeat protein
MREGAQAVNASGRSFAVVCVVLGLALSLVAQPAYAQGQVHIVQRGETLYSIAVRYGTSVNALTQANGLANPRVIYAGQRLTIPSGSEGTSAATTGGPYVVRPGDTLSSIAVRHGTTVDAIVRANGLANPRVIYAGQRLTIPGGGYSGEGGSAPPTSGSYVVRPGDTLSSIAVQYGTTVNAIVQANGLANPRIIYAGQRLIMPGAGSSGGGGGQTSAGGAVYTVQRGDTLASIAYRYGTTIWAIANANGLANPRYIYAGQQLRIPSGSSTALAPATNAAPAGGKRIVIDLSAQRMYVYQNGQLLWTWVVSTGRPGQATVVGNYQVLNKIPNAYASTWGLQMPYWLGIYWAGRLQNGIHALPIQANGQILWDGYLGQRVSFGCIILSTQNAATLYNWATVGTPVDIVW